jgi:hypothetical protein
MRAWTSFFVLFTFIACDGKESGDDSGAFDGGSDEELAEALWAAIDGFQDWPQPTEWDGVQASEDGTHGDFVQIFGDSGTLAAVSAGSEIPDGGILVKCGFDAVDGTIEDDCTLTAMQKVSGYDADHGDWFWAKFDLATGDVQLSGQVSGCFGCHTDVDSDSDFVLYDDVAAGDE